MGEIVSLIQKIQADKDEDAFKELINEMEPSIKKYEGLLYKDEKEDVRSEMTLALWEAVPKIKYYKNEKSCFAFLCNALKIRFLELYRKSRKWHDNQTPIEDVSACNVSNVKNIGNLDNVVFNIDVEIFLREYTGKKQEMFRMIITSNESDIEIAKAFSVTRQYVNRVRRELYKEIRNRNFI
jgi:hypothetical protein